VKLKPWKVALLAIAALLALYYLSIPVFGPHFAEVCSKGEQGKPDQCAYWDAVTAVILRGLIFADEHNGSIAALAGVAVAIFTAVLWVSTDKLWRLGNREFEATHRPWLAIRDARLIGRVLLDATTITVKAQFLLENTSDVPALDVALSGALCPEIEPGLIIELRSRAISQYAASFIDGLPPQNQVIFPDEKAPYSGELKMEYTDATAELVRNLLIVAVFVYESKIGGKRTVYYTSGVYSIELPIDEDTLGSARSGTGHLLNAKLERHSIGWTAE
jgi:hypothetical protein